MILIGKSCADQPPIKVIDLDLLLTMYKPFGYERYMPVYEEQIWQQMAVAGNFGLSALMNKSIGTMSATN